MESDRGGWVGVVVRWSHEFDSAEGELGLAWLGWTKSKGRR